jgi:hypothetical protein
MLRAEDACAFSGGFLEKAERALRRSWLDGTFRPWVGAVNAACTHMRLAREKGK